MPLKDAKLWHCNQNVLAGIVVKSFTFRKANLQYGLADYSNRSGRWVIFTRHYSFSNENINTPADGTENRNKYARVIKRHIQSLTLRK